MILVALFIGAIIIVAAFRGTYGALFTALGQDVPAYVIWAAAILALGALGYVPGLKPISRGLMALVLIVIVLRNYQQILTGFQSVSTAPSASSSTSMAPADSIDASNPGAAPGAVNTGQLSTGVIPSATNPPATPAAIGSSAYGIQGSSFVGVLDTEQNSAFASAPASVQ